MALDSSALADRHVRSLRHVLGNPALLSTRLADRIAYAHDASPIALKQAAIGQLPFLPGAIVWPSNVDEVSAVLRWAQEARVSVVPFGGGSGIVGGALASRVAITIDLKRLDRILEIDRTSLLARVQTGINGQILEDRLNARGYTLGHLPQSIRASTLGGWMAHRAAGVASTRYGKIEDIVQALQVVLPTGNVLQTRAIPRSSTGPNLDQLFLGSEGAYGIITEATLAIRPMPETRQWQAYAFATFDEAVDAIRQVIQGDRKPAIVRLYDPGESAPHLEHTDVPADSVLLLWGCEGPADLVAFELNGIRRICAGTALRDLGPKPGERWWDHRLSTAGLLTTLCEPAGIADALEITATWSALSPIYTAMKADMETAAGEHARVFGHVSHVYPTGGNLYMIFHAKARTPDAVPALYDRILEAAFTACQERGGSLSHHHGVGATKARWLPYEHGETGLHVMRAVQRILDPAGIMNPGVGFYGGK